ncbi:MAG: AAA family ATPase, partial [Candidatus Aminicenantes bacterium]|nr:AAA family ATPase [Candidatus Aminicenantes bacterium]
MTNRPPLIGLTGTNGAGKGEAAKYLASLGYASYSLSDILREELAARGEAATRDNLIRVGNELRARFGPDILALRTLKKLPPGGRAVIDSIRNAREVAAFRRQPDF